MSEGITSNTIVLDGAFYQLTELLHGAGWRCPSDAQWQNLASKLPQMADILKRLVPQTTVRPYAEVMKQTEREGVDAQDLIATLMKKVEDQRLELARLNVKHRTAVGTRVPVTDRRVESAISEEGVPLCSAQVKPLQRYSWKCECGRFNTDFEAPCDCERSAPKAYGKP